MPDALAQTGGDLYAVILNVAVNAWMAGHLTSRSKIERTHRRLSSNQPRSAEERIVRGGQYAILSAMQSIETVQR
ncbi:hypothetical protein ACFC0P_38560, partial [Streptomyces broussonetiae]